MWATGGYCTLHCFKLGFKIAFCISSTPSKKHWKIYTHKCPASMMWCWSTSASFLQEASCSLSSLLPAWAKLSVGEHVLDKPTDFPTFTHTGCTFMPSHTWHAQAFLTLTRIKCAQMRESLASGSPRALKSSKKPENLCCARKEQVQVFSALGWVHWQWAVAVGCVQHAATIDRCLKRCSFFFPQLSAILPLPNINHLRALKLSNSTTALPCDRKHWEQPA